MKGREKSEVLDPVLCLLTRVLHCSTWCRIEEGSNSKTDVRSPPFSPCLGL